MSEQLEQVKDTIEPVVVQTENASTSVEAKQEAEIPVVPEWEKRIKDLELAHEREIKRLEHGIGKSIGKIRQKNKTLEEIVNKFIPDPSAMSFKSEEEKKAYEQYANPIRQEIQQKNQEFEKLEQEETAQESRMSLVNQTISKLQAVEGAQEIFTKYQTAITADPACDVDDDILAFTSQNPNLLRTLYESPEYVKQIKKMPQSIKMATLSSLMIQSSMTNAKAPVIAVPTAKVNQPATPPKGGGGGGQSPINSAKTAQEYLEALRKRK